MGLDQSYEYWLSEPAADVIARIHVRENGGLPLTAGYVVSEISRQLRLLQQHSVASGELAGASVGGAMRGVE